MSGLTDQLTGKGDHSLPDIVDTARDRVSAQTKQVVSGLQDLTDSYEVPSLSDVTGELALKARSVAGLSEPETRWFGVRPRWVLLAVGAGSAAAGLWWFNRRRQKVSATQAFKEQLSPQEDNPVHEQKAHDTKTSAEHAEHTTGQSSGESRLDESTGPLSQRAHDAQSAYPSNDQPAVEPGDEMSEPTVATGQGEGDKGSS